ncbi:AraC family transcriptional regulator [Aliarcobacter butzleri]|uniref:AraC family transcriptional regulator n=1 Tax=Aliarcobacter butzleri TaxID=28197 RepID=A0AAW7Q0Q6_9BACT|nr:AraC family transcriptional regulator [Aliarcobacter butzleri]MCG3675272.1 AraC family transcriptional regulator [Aliarcobacter butzleri]MCG3714227.1 AraC family transcriptional regulator [Aliarcobacter butzleri]MCT7586252.1 AraC family transcriptional regulator [Aliarcobacter butzleri]MDN5108080.1 AraC family transcriptional regulator [Aliarcobacter butzleri]MDN5111102.1 AraC family transcriptional regulator [Aliarcobacter butzleri]
MRKKETFNRHQKLAFKVLEHINRYIDTDINIDYLANELEVDRFHLQKVFKEQFDTNIYETIKSIRLQKASNLLLTNIRSTITEIANSCGYSSQTSFITAFKKKFNQTPKEWKKGGYIKYSNTILETAHFNLDKKFDYSKLEPKIVKMQNQKAYYILQRGYNYNDGINNWKKIQAWAYTHNVKECTQIGIFHDNPVITPSNDCFYTAAIVPKGLTDEIKSNLSTLNIDKGLYATFEITGKFGEVLPLIRWAYHEWLPSSGFETNTKPSFAIFHKNPVFDENKEFEATFYLPIQYS